MFAHRIYSPAVTEATFPIEVLSGGCVRRGDSFLIGFDNNGPLATLVS